jgi:hypothetical protein
LVVSSTVSVSGADSTSVEGSSTAVLVSST